LNEFIYRSFGQISDLLDRNLEALVINALSGPGYCPKIFETDNKTYRIEEFIREASELPRAKLFETNTLNQIISILNSYTLISNVYTYSIYGEGQDEIMINTDITASHYKSERINQNIYDMCTGTMLNKAIINFSLFSEHVFSKLDRNKDKGFFAKFDLIKDTIQNYKIEFASIFPKEGLLVLNHNDVHRLNILQKTNGELMILDHEYAALNLIGNDIVNYLIESSFDYTVKEYPFYEFNSEVINFKSFYEIFVNFVEKFENSHQEDLTNEDIVNKFNNIKNYSYFLKLVCVISLFWFLYGVIYLDLDKLTKKNKFDYMEHSINRLAIYKLAKSELQKFEM
jgi:thiamine kinase-like enzyme